MTLIRSFLSLVKTIGFTRATRVAWTWLVERFRVSTAGGFNPGFEVYDLEPNTRTLAKTTLTSETPVIWFIPAWTNVWGGGHLTLFRFAHLMSKKRPQLIFVYDNKNRFDKKYFESSLQKAFPGNSLTVVIDSDHIPEICIPVATTWQSVFPLLKFTPKSDFRFYFMQDYEGLFYAHGTQSMQALASYEQGLKGITGGPWLLKNFKDHGGDGINYMFTTDREIFFPAETLRPSVKRIFFYGRPSTERRCFELGIEALKQVKIRHPEIEIVMAGLDGIGDVGFEVTKSGSVSVPELGNLYRSCDIGLALSGTNLSYLPVELMACGVPVVTNSGPQVEWYCEDNVNSLVVDPFPSSIANAIEDLIGNFSLREYLITNGLQKAKETDWASEATKISDYIEAQLSS